MKKFLLVVLLLSLGANLRAEITLGPWQPLFQGIEHAVGTNLPDGQIPALQVANCMKVDLHDPGVQLFPTPPASNYVAGSVETYTLTVSNFLKNHHLAVATDANFYNANPGGSDPNSEGLPCRVYGMQISTGAVVSLPDTGPDSNGRYTSLLFTTNKQPILAFNNRPPGVDTTGIYSAISGYYPIVSNGVNIGPEAAVSYPDPSIHDYQPRTLFGLSQDRRYLFMVTIDGRQPGYSDGATDVQSAAWMQQFGAWDAINMDGGGSTAMYRADCAGNPVAVNHSSYIGVSGGARERIIGSHLGVYARPLPIVLKDLRITPGTTTALVQWSTETEATTRVEYGPTASYGNATPLDSRPTTQHVATLTGLSPGATYYYQAISVSGADTLTAGCSFSTTNVTASRTLVFDVASTWKYTSNNLDGVNWKTPGYDDSSWSGPGPGLLYIESNTAVAPRNTPLPTPLMRTYYFRKHFSFTGSKTDLALSFSTYLDDGAVFYLNGAEIYRLRLPAAPTPIANSTSATAQPCAGTFGANDATCADLFDITGNPVNNLAQGDNVLAVEVHNFSTTGDLVFGSAMILSRFASTLPTLNILTEPDLATLYWNGDGFTLQQSVDLSSSTNWVDVPGPVTIGPATMPTSATTFYRLRR